MIELFNNYSYENNNINRNLKYSQENVINVNKILTLNKKEIFDGFNYLIKNKIKLDPNPDNNKSFKWDKDIFNTKMASCSEFSMFIFKYNIRKNLNSFIAKIGYYKENLGMYHIISGYYLNNKTFIQNYADTDFYEMISYNCKPKEAIEKYLNKFSKIMKEHMGLKNINGLKPETLISTNAKEMLQKYEYSNISQKEILTLLNFH